MIKLPDIHQQVLTQALTSCTFINHEEWGLCGFVAVGPRGDPWVPGWYSVYLTSLLSIKSIFCVRQQVFSVHLHVVSYKLHAGVDTITLNFPTF